MKKLVLVLRSAQTGGVENHARDILASAPGHGYAPGLISLADVPVAPPFLELGIEIHRLGDAMSGSLRSLANIQNLARLIKSIDPDVVHLHGARPLFVGSLAARMAGIRAVVSTLHGSYKLMAYDKATSRIDPVLLTASKVVHTTGFALSKRVIVDADALLDEVREACRFLPVSYGRIRAKTVTIHPCVDFSKAGPGLDNAVMRRRLGIEEDAVVVGSIGRLDEPMKGIRVLLNAVRALLNQGIAFKTVIVGEGYSRSELERYSEALGLADWVRFLGFWKDLQDIFNVIDIFVQPSFSEGFPLVNLEAMENAVPVVATDVGGVSEAVMDGCSGFVVPPRDAGALAEAIKTLVGNDGLRRSMGTHAREISGTRFLHSAMLDRIFSIYDEVASGK